MIPSWLKKTVDKFIYEECYPSTQSQFDAFWCVAAQMQTKRSVRSEMDLKVVMMGQPGSVEVQKFPHALISIYLVLAFTPFVTFLIVNVAAEKEHRLKDTMTMMGLYDTAFWWERNGHQSVPFMSCWMK